MNAVEKATQALHSAGWFARADIEPTDLTGIIYTLLDAGLLSVEDEQ